MKYLSRTIIYKNIFICDHFWQIIEKKLLIYLSIDYGSLPKGNLTAFPTIKSSNRKVFDEIRSHFLFNFKKINSEQFQKLSIYKSSIVQFYKFYNLETDTAMDIFLVHLKVCCKVYIKQ